MKRSIKRVVGWGSGVAIAVVLILVAVVIIIATNSATPVENDTQQFVESEVE